MPLMPSYSCAARTCADAAAPGNTPTSMTWEKIRSMPGCKTGLTDCSASPNPGTTCSCIPATSLNTRRGFATLSVCRNSAPSTDFSNIFTSSIASKSACTPGDMSMHDGQPPAQIIYWPRVKVILDGIMDRWQTRWGREPYEGIHEYRWDTPQQLAI